MITVPTNFKPTHETAGLPGFPAVDLFAAPGTPVAMSEPGAISRISGHDPQQPPPQGVGGPWGLSVYFRGRETNGTYYLTHFVKVRRLGPVDAGDVVGIIGDYPGLAGDHVHIGLHPGNAAAAHEPSKTFHARCYLDPQRAPRPSGGPLAHRLKRAGIVFPQITIDEAKRTGCPLPVLCAVLERESNGGHNVFGHDPTIFAGAGEVTEAKYRAYKRARDASRPRRMQGVGPMQLTWWEYQDRADQLGGCWAPRYNIRVGAGILADAIRRAGVHAALKAYNGSSVYADEVSIRLPHWNQITG